MKRMEEINVAELLNIYYELGCALEIIGNKQAFLEDCCAATGQSFSRQTFINRWMTGKCSPTGNRLLKTDLVDIAYYYYEAAGDPFLSANTLLKILKLHGYDVSCYGSSFPMANGLSEKERKRLYGANGELFDRIVQELSEVAFPGSPDFVREVTDATSFRGVRLPVDLSNCMAICIGDIPGGGSIVTYDSANMLLEYTCDFSKTNAGLCALVIYLSGLDLSFDHETRALFFQLKTDHEFPITVEIQGASVHGSDPVNRRKIVGESCKKDFRIPLDTFIGTRNYSYITKISFVVNRNELMKGAFELKQLEFL